MSKKVRVTIFGATGKTGSDLLRLLSDAGIDTLAVTRHLANAHELPFVRWVKADMADKHSLYQALDARDAVFLLSGAGPDVVLEQSNVIEACKGSGVAHVVKLSSGAASKDSLFYIPRTHGEIEELLKCSGMAWTMLRPNGIMQNWLRGMADSVKKKRMFFESTGDGKRSHVDRRDIAEVAFACLTEGAPHFGKTYLLTSEKAVSYHDVAEAIGKVVGEEVTYVPISPDAARRSMEEERIPHALIETFLSYDLAQRNGETAMVSDSVRNILKRPARSLEDFVNDYAERFQ